MVLKREKFISHDGNKYGIDREVMQEIVGWVIQNATQEKRVDSYSKGDSHFGHRCCKKCEEAVIQHYYIVPMGDMFYDVHLCTGCEEWKITM